MTGDTVSRKAVTKAPLPGTCLSWPPFSCCGVVTNSGPAPTRPMRGFCEDSQEGDVDYRDDMDEGASPADVDRLLRLSRQDSRNVIRQMLAVVPGQPEAGQERSPRPRVRPEGEGVRYDEAFRRTARVLSEAHDRVRRERGLAIVQWATLEGHPPARQLVMVRNDERLHHWGLYDLLLEKSRGAAPRDAGAAMNLAEMALAVAERLSPEIYGEERLADFKTTALAALGDARRTAADLAGSRLASSQARIPLAMG